MGTGYFSLGQVTIHRFHKLTFSFNPDRVRYLATENLTCPVTALELEWLPKYVYLRTGLNQHLETPPERHKLQMSCGDSILRLASG